MRLTLRDYQQEALDRVEAALARGVRRPMIVAATGLGKTVMFCALAERMRARTLILAHRDELIEQAAAKVREVWPDADVGIVKAERDEHDAQVVVASVQTLARPRRLHRLTDSSSLLRPAAPFDLIVVDEAHHTAADSYRRILAHLRAGERERAATGDEVDAGYELGIVPDGPVLLGVTATPDRGDGKGLDDLFDEIVASYDILWGIRSGYLADLRGLTVALDVDLDQVKVSRGDFDAGAAGAAIAHAGGPDVIAEAWLVHARGRRTLVFTPTVELAADCADAFRHRGISAEYVHGGMDVDERRRVLRAFSRGEIDVIANCAVLTEGYDEPRVDCIVVARPTKSRALYTQMVGRGTRRHPDKDDCLVIDVVGASRKHALVTIPSLFGVGGKFRKRLADGSMRVAHAVDEFTRAEIARGRLRAEEVALFADRIESQHVAWVNVTVAGGLRRYERGLGHGGTETTVVLQQLDRDADRWVAGIIEADGHKRTLILDVPLEMAQGVGEDVIRKMGHGASPLVRADAPWRSRKPTPKQLAAAAKWRVAVDPAWTAGELSDVIARKAALARRHRR